MLNGIYSSATALNSSSMQHEVIAHNLANLNVAGFRRTLLAVEERGASTRDQDDQRGSPTLRGNQVVRETIDFTKGALRSTGRALDVAIDGEGFFSIQGNDETLYTRGGFFHVGPDGSIVNSDGLPLLGNGSPVKIPTGIDASTLEIGSDGSIKSGDTEIGKIDLVDFEIKGVLSAVGSASFRASPDAVTQLGTGQVVQGSLEMANTHAVTEMIQMITGSRHFESAQRALRTIAESIEKFTNMDQ